MFIEADSCFYRDQKVAATQRMFLNRDPIEEDGGLNLYGFVENDAANQWDYLGQFGGAGGYPFPWGFYNPRTKNTTDAPTPNLWFFPCFSG